MQNTTHQMIRRSRIAGFVIGGAYGKHEPKAKHFLAVHDAVKEVDPTVQVIANISNRGPYQAHMQLLHDPANFDVSRAIEFTMKLQDVAHGGVIENTVHPCRLEMKYFDGCRLTATLGYKNVTPEDVIREENYDRRVALRYSLGCDEIAYSESCSDLIRTATTMCIQSTGGLLGANNAYAIPRLYWLAACETAYNLGGDIHPRRVSIAAMNFLNNREKLPNPLLPEEDLNSLRAVCSVRSIDESSVAARYLRNTHMQQVNIVDTGFVPTQEEYEQMLIDKGIIPKPDPNRKLSLLERIFGPREPPIDSSKIKIPEGAQVSPPLYYDDLDENLRRKKHEFIATDWIDNARRW